MSLIAYHNDSKLKAKLVAEAIAHREADQYRKGIYWDSKEQKGCSIGCMLQSDDHALSESLWGIPEALTHLQDRFFENTPDAYSETWTERYFEAIPVGADLSLVSWRILYWNLTENIAIDDSTNAAEQAHIEECRRAIKQCADVIEPLTRGEAPDKSAARAAYCAANTAQSQADRAPWVASAVSCAASAASWAVASIWVAAPVWGAVAVAWAWAADEAGYVAMAEKLLEFLANAPIAVQITQPN